MRFFQMIAISMLILSFSAGLKADPIEKEKIYSIPVDSSIKHINFSIVFKPERRDTSFDLLEKTGGQNFYLQPDELEKAAKIILATTGEIIFLGNSFLGAETEKNISVITPRGKIINPAEAGVEITDWKAGTVISIANPETGDWKLIISGKGNFSARVNAKTEIHFIDFDFVKLMGRPGHEGYFPIEREPAIDAEQILEINFSEDVGETTPPQFSLIDESGRVISTPEFFIVRRGAVAEFTGVVKIPPQDFRIAAVGIDKNGFRYQRMYAAAISPKLKPAPLSEAELEEFKKNYSALPNTSR